MKKRAAVVVLYCVAIYAAGASPVFGQEKETDLKDKRISIRMEKQPLGLIFRYLMENYDVPIGFEESVLDRGYSDYDFEVNLPAVAKHTMASADGRITATTKSERAFKATLHPITVNVENGRVEEVFTQIVKQMENYTWEINGGVVNIFPIKGRDERFKNLLEINISRFTLERGQTVGDITTKIMSLDEFLRFMYDNKLLFSGVREGANFVLKAQYGRRLDVGMDFSHLTFRDLLNKITKIKRGGWVLKWRGISKRTGGEHINIDI
jgi:hypothetical protein